MEREGRTRVRNGETVTRVAETRLESLARRVSVGYMTGARSEPC